MAENQTAIACMISLEVNEEELTKRLLLRGQTSGRPDDQNEELVRKRVQEYNSKTAPVADFYARQGKFHAINGIGDIEEIFNQTCAIIDSYLTQPKTL
jgi:adenylate kinase